MVERGGRIQATLAENREQRAGALNRASARPAGLDRLSRTSGRATASSTSTTPRIGASATPRRSTSKATFTRRPIEGFFGNLKRGIAGTYHAVSRKWLQGYLNEYTWRYNRREDERAMFLQLIDDAPPCEGDPSGCLGLGFLVPVPAPQRASGFLEIAEN